MTVAPKCTSIFVSKAEERRAEFLMKERAAAQKPVIEIMEWSAGDWVRILVNGQKFREGHDLSTYDVIELLQHLGFEVKQTEVASEDDN